MDTISTLLNINPNYIGKNGEINQNGVVCYRLIANHFVSLKFSIK